MSNIFSEVTNSSGMLKSPLGFPHGEGPQAGVPGTGGLGGPGGFAGKPGLSPPETHHPGPRRDDFTWLSICYTLLFFSASPIMGSPYAFVELQRVSVTSVQQDNRTLTLTGIPEAEDQDADLAAAGGGGPTINNTGDSSPTMGQGTGGIGKGGTSVTIVLLLPDGRWQELSLPKLELRIPTANELEMWNAHLTAACQGKVMRPSSAKSASPRHGAKATRHVPVA